MDAFYTRGVRHVSCFYRSFLSKNTSQPERYPKIRKTISTRYVLCLTSNVLLKPLVLIQSFALEPIPIPQHPGSTPEGSATSPGSAMGRIPTNNQPSWLGQHRIQHCRSTLSEQGGRHQPPATPQPISSPLRGMKLTNTMQIRPSSSQYRGSSAMQCRGKVGTRFR